MTWWISWEPPWPRDPLKVLNQGNEKIICWVLKDVSGFYFKHGLIVTQGRFKEKDFLEVNVISRFIPPNSLKKEMENFGWLSVSLACLSTLVCPNKKNQLILFNL